MNEKINYKALVLVVIASVFGSIGGRYLIDYFGKNKNIFDKQLIEAANEINKNLPIMIDSETRLDSTMALPNKHFVYYYTLVNYSEDELDAEELKNIMQPVLLNNIKTNSGLKDFKENKVTMVYVYRDKEGRELFELSFDYDDYKE